MEVFQVWPASLYIAALVLGLLVGSFLNVVVYRVPLMMEREWRAQCEELLAQPGDPSTLSPPQTNVGHPRPKTERFNLLWPPSSCTACGSRIKARHNVPVLSYMWLHGRCADCGASISQRYPLVEISAALVAVAAAWVLGPTWQLLAALLFAWALLALALIDIDHQLLPDLITLPMLWIGILLSLFSVHGMPLFTDVRSAVVGAAAGYLSLWSIHHLFKLLTKKEGMGYGDFKLLATIGAWLGWQMLPLVILLSAAVGALISSAFLLSSGKSRNTPIPFGPYLAAAGLIAMLWGDGLLAWYLQSFA